MSDGAEASRSPWEAIDEHWRARIQFIEEHKATYGPDKALTLSHVWHNVYYHGARYPPDVQQLVSRWEPNLDDLPVPLISKKKEISGGSSLKAATTPLVGTDCDVTPLITDADLPDVDLSSISHELLSLSKKVFIEEISSIKEPVNSIYNCAQKSKISIKFDEIRNQVKRDSQVMLTAILDGVRVASAAGLNRKAAKYEAALAALKLLIGLQRQQGIGQTPRWKPSVNEEEAVGRNALVDGKQTDERLPDSNVGSQLLMKMGWSGSGGLGKGENKGIATPLMLTGNLGREGLGANSGEKTIDRQRVEYELRQFVVNSDAKELTFSSDLTQEDRRIVHEVAQRLHLKHRSFDVDGRRHLVLSKATTAAEREARKEFLRAELEIDGNHGQTHRQMDGNYGQTHRQMDGNHGQTYRQRDEGLGQTHRHADGNHGQTHRQTDGLKRKHGREEYGGPMNDYSIDNAKMARFDYHHGHARQYHYDDRTWDDPRNNYRTETRYGHGHGHGHVAWQGRS
ncbi:uncharacterized protein LOC134183414 [Corticium candelabrum]|uniref:uncharacterized protein LOC134183414 n=1 Tax=Corticium candelabrum TaxID=121492 RepID=UPI002E267A40|nr:uncharacterized protein LOC134183414 [Corticium candelabrum]